MAMTGRKLLVLDDDPHIGRMVQLIGESVGLGVRFTTLASEFFELLDDWQPTHILVDLIMPEVDGMEVLRHVAVHRCTAAVIISSGVGTRVLDAARSSAAAYGLKILGTLTKPFSPQMLRLLLRDAARPEDTSATVREPADPTAAELRHALGNHELQLVYQPQVHCATHALTGFEALVRWEHPRQGTIMPDRFIGIAERAGLIDALTDQVLREAIAWHRGLPPGCQTTVSVNLSSFSIAGVVRELVDRIADLVDAGGIRPDEVVLEVTESGAMENPMVSLDLLKQLHCNGFHVSLDDFGTGYSSMVQLVRLPFGEIKIDRSFVTTALASTESRAVVESVIALGHSLGSRVVAEGIEDSTTLRLLRDAGCDVVQGYFIARPMSGTAALAWAAEHSHRMSATGLQAPSQ
jgi:EAL domain-containing protein (putative c-di-GMP-specific phosphodiesterase class I)/ActR/RegA family two-component response regulator